MKFSIVHHFKKFLISYQFIILIKSNSNRLQILLGFIGRWTSMNQNRIVVLWNHKTSNAIFDVPPENENFENIAKKETSVSLILRVLPNQIYWHIPSNFWRTKFH